MKNNKGITLVSLIVTIIVMLILAGIALAFSVGDSGVITRAEQSLAETEKKEIFEQLAGTIEYHNDTAKKMAKTAKNIQKTFGDKATFSPDIGSIDDNTEQFLVTIKGKNGEYTYKIPKRGEIVIVENLNLSELEKYILGEDGQGKDLMFMLASEELYKDEEFGFELLSYKFDLEAAENGEEKYIVSCKYNGNEYYEFKVTYSWNEETEEEFLISDSGYGVQLILKIEEGSKLGKKVKYDGKYWTVAYDDEENGLQIICDEALTNKDGSEIKLGSKDQTIVESEITRYTEFSVLPKTDYEDYKDSVERALHSYNNAITTLNTIAEGLVTKKEGIIKSVRSVGSYPADPSREAGVYYSDKIEKLGEGIDGYYPEILNGKGYGTDNNYLSDYERMAILGILRTTNERDYWLASRNAYFYIRKDGDINDSFAYALCVIRDDYMPYLDDERIVRTEDDSTYSSAYGGSAECYIRPVITLDSDVLKNVEGDGINTPYDIDKKLEDDLITNATSDTIPNGTYYYLGMEETGHYLKIDNNNTELCIDSNVLDVTMTINKGVVTMTRVIDGEEFVFEGNYYETKNNKILTLSYGEFSTKTYDKNNRPGYLFALNKNDLKTDINGVCKSSIFSKGGYIEFGIDGENIAKHRWAKGSLHKTYYYIGFRNSFYLGNDSDAYEIKYSALTEGFGLGSIDGIFTLEK